MYRKMKNFWPVIATSLVAFSSLCAATNSSNGSMKTSTPPAKKKTNTSDKSKGYDLSIDAAAILWKVNADGSEFAAGGAGRHVDTLETDYDWGFRVGLAYTMPHDRWNIRLGWDRLRAGASESTDAGWSPFGQTAGAGGVQITLPPQEALFNPVNFSISSHWHLDYDTLDLALKREFQFSKWLCLAPHVGLRSAWIYQDQHFTFGKAQANPPNSNPTETKAKNHFWGLGIRAGFDSQWGLGRGWSIFGNAAGALLYGNYKVDTDVLEGFYMDSEDGSWEGSHSFHASRACADWMLGLRWNHMFKDNRYGLTLQAAYEQNIYWNMFESTVPGANAHEGDLWLTGWTFAAKFDF